MLVSSINSGGTDAAVLISRAPAFVAGTVKRGICSRYWRSSWMRCCAAAVWTVAAMAAVSVDWIF